MLYKGEPNQRRFGNRVNTRLLQVRQPSSFSHLQMQCKVIWKQNLYTKKEAYMRACDWDNIGRKKNNMEASQTNRTEKE